MPVILNGKIEGQKLMASVSADEPECNTADVGWCLYLTDWHL